jgi:hypothetical protein
VSNYASWGEGGGGVSHTLERGTQSVQSLSNNWALDKRDARENQLNWIMMRCVHGSCLLDHPHATYAGAIATYARPAALTPH